MKKIDIENFLERLEKLYFEKYSQIELSNYLGVHRTTLIGWLDHNRKPQRKTVNKLLEKLSELENAKN